MIGITTRTWLLLALVGCAATSAGCHSTLLHKQSFIPPDVPKELSKVNLPEYRVEPPDILLIEAVRAIPKPPYRAEPLDVLYVSLAVPVPGEPLAGAISVEPDGTINLGAAYGGSVSVVGKTIPEIKDTIEKHLTATVKLMDPKITVSLAQGRTGQRISGPHLIRPDGTISLGTYGSVRVTGMTLAEVRRAVEMHLSQFLLDPEISVDVQNYNSKIFYVVLDGAGAGQTVVRLPITGNETVMDAVAQVNGLTAVSSQDRIWVSRPAPEGGCHQILPVDWRAVVEQADPATNYQILPGDRVFVAAYPLTKLDIVMARMIAPIERAFGVVLLGTNTINNIRFPRASALGGGFGGF
jgi:polysaccharide export outer membrane protein